MALNLKGLEKALGLESGTLEKAKESEEVVDINFDHLKIFQKKDYDTLIANQSKEMEEKKAIYKSVGAEEALKKVVREVLPEGFEGRKDIEKVINGIKNLKNDGSNTDYEKELNSYKEALANKDNEYKQALSEHEEVIKNFKAKEDNNTINSTLRGHFAELEGKTTLNEKDALALYSIRRGLKVNDGKVNIYKDGELMKDDILNPLDVGTDFSNFMKDYIKTPEGGRGGQDDKGRGEGVLNPDQFVESFQKQNPNATQGEVMSALSSAINNGKVK